MLFNPKGMPLLQHASEIVNYNPLNLAEIPRLARKVTGARSGVARRDMSFVSCCTSRVAQHLDLAGCPSTETSEPV